MKPMKFKIWKHGKYMRIEGAHGHPLASSLGRIPYHRYVLWNALGKPETSQCVWCGFELPWVADPSIDTAIRYKYVVNADHLDGVTTHNSPSNLATSCYWCNLNRHFAEDHPQEWFEALIQFDHIHPSERPDMRVFLSEKHDL